MTITVGTNSYVTVEDADAYFAARLYADDWGYLINLDKERALLMACRTIDQQCFVGLRTDTDQMLAWPRIGALDIDIGTVPQAVKDAQCEMALAFIRKDLTLDNNMAGVRRKLERVGPLEKEIEYDGRAPVRTLPDAVAALLRPFLKSSASANSVRMVV